MNRIWFYKHTFSTEIFLQVKIAEAYNLHSQRKSYSDLEQFAFTLERMEILASKLEFSLFSRKAKKPLKCS